MILEHSMDASDWQAYVKQVAGVQGYALEGPQTERVAEQMALVARIAQPLLGLQLAVEEEPASVFRPLMRT